MRRLLSLFAATSLALLVCCTCVHAQAPVKPAANGAVISATSSGQGVAGSDRKAVPATNGISKGLSDAPSDHKGSGTIPTTDGPTLPLGDGIGKPAPLTPPADAVVHVHEARIQTEQDKANAAKSMEEYNRLKATQPTKDIDGLRAPQPNDAVDPNHGNNQ